MNCAEIIQRLEQLAPVDYAQEWDNPGLQCGRLDKTVKKVLIALDATDEVVAQAVREGADMLLTHHPLIFKPIKNVTDMDFLGRRLIKLIQADVSYYAMHTNYDAAPGCMADLAAKRLELKDGQPLEVTGDDAGTPFGIGKVGVLSEAMTVSQLAELVKVRFQLPFVTVYGTGQVTEPVSTVAISPGAGGSMLRYALDSGADILVTGDIGHHQGIDAAACRMAVIDAGHFGLEHIFMEHLEQYLQKAFEDKLELVVAREDFPVKVI